MKIEQGLTPVKRALVVDDEPIIAHIFQAMLAADGFSVNVAADGDTAREMATQDTFDLCILNIHIPGMNGMDLYEFLKKERPELSARTLFTTGDILSGSTEAFLKKSGRPYLLKPFGPDELRVAVRNATSRADR